MSSIAKRSGCAVALMLCASCRSEAVASSRAMPPVASASTAVALVPSFRKDVLPTIEHECAAAKGCHGAEPTDSVDLDLTSGAAYAELVAHPSEVRRGMLRVKPGAPEESFLINKLSGDLRTDEGKRMPLDPDTGAPLEPNPITDGFVRDVLASWIRAGATDD